MRFPRFKCLFIILLTIFIHLYLNADETRTYYDENNCYITTGNINLSLTTDTVIELIKNCSEYNTWALKGLDGKDAVSKDFVGILAGVDYFQETDSIEVIYDVNLFPPFGSKNNRMKFEIIQSEEKDNFLNIFQLIKGSILLKEASLSLYLEKTDSPNCVLHYTANAKFSWLLNIFLNVDNYRRNIEWRIIQLLSNMNNYRVSYNQQTSEVLL